MQIHLLFPQPVYCEKLGRTLIEDELNVIDKFKPTNYNKAVTLQSSDNYILEKKELKNLKEELNKMIVDYFNKIVCTRNSVPPYITQSWINYTRANQHHKQHTHPNSYISGVFYINADPKIDTITFYRRKYDRIELESKEFNSFKTTTWYLKIETGDGLLFPSDLVHGVETKKGANLRISLSFNVFLKGPIGLPTKLTEVIL